MNARLKLEMTAGQSILGAFLTLAILSKAVLFRDALSTEYPLPPFRHLEPDYPKLIVDRERPGESQITARNAFDTERQDVFDYFNKYGAISGATSVEAAAVHAVLSERFITGRELAETILAANPLSVFALYARGIALAEGESNLPRGIHELVRMRRILEARGREKADDRNAREWYIRGLLREQYYLALMDRNEDNLRVVELLEDLGVLPELKIYSLYKLNRRDEARANLTLLEKGGHWPVKAANLELILALGRGESYAIARQMVVKAEESAVIWHNFSEKCRADFRPDEAEAALIKSAKFKTCDFCGTPYLPLASLYIDECRFSEAWTTLKKAQLHRFERDIETLTQDQADLASTTATLMLFLGKEEQALRSAQRACDRPNRNGCASITDGQARYANGLLLWVALRARIAEIREFVPGQTWRECMLALRELIQLELESWVLQQEVQRFLSSDDRLVATLRVYLADNSCDPWQLGSLARILPRGILFEALRRARTVEEHASVAPYFDATEAELCLVSGEPARALTLARASLARLPPDGAKLLRARVSAVGAQAAFQLGREQEGLALIDPVLTNAPAMLRITGTKLPVQIVNDASPLARQLAMILEASPRFEISPTGFPLRLRSANGQLSFELFRLDRSVLLSGAVPVGADSESATALAARRLHERLVTPTIDLSQMDINSLDGSATIARSVQAVDTMLDVMKPR